jgi:hypothetical protein
LIHSSGWPAYLAEHGHKGETLQFADKTIAIDSRSKKKEQLVAITDKAFYYLTESSDTEGEVSVKRRVGLSGVKAFLYSRQTRQFVIHVPSESDLWFEGRQRKNIAKLLKKFVPYLKLYSKDIKSLKKFVRSDSEADDPFTGRPSPNDSTKSQTFSAEQKEFAYNEIVQSEKKFCTRVSLLLKHFVFPLDIWRNKKSIMKNRSQWLKLFDNFNAVARFHIKHFYPRLQAAVVEKKSVGDVFSERLKLLLNVYTPYLTHWQKFQEGLKELAEKEIFLNFFKTKKVNLGCASSDSFEEFIESLCILPIERITEYMSFIGRILKQTDFDKRDEGDFFSLKQFREKIIKLAVQCKRLLDTEQE